MTVRRVLVVGRGAPDTGGIASYMQVLATASFSGPVLVETLSVTRSGPASVRKASLHNVARAVRDAWDVWQIASDFDVVHVHSALASYLVVARAGLLAVAARQRGCRVIVHAHSGRMQSWLRPRPRRLFTRLCLASAHVVVTVASGGKDVLARTINPNRVRLVVNGVDLGRFVAAPTDHTPPRILFAGVLTTRKGVMDLLEAHRELLARGFDHELLIAGGQPPEGSASAAAVRERPTPGVRWLGAVPQDAMPELYRAADIFCLPSWGEAMPMAVLEAMASGLPVVATRVGDVPRAVHDGVTGLLVAPRDVTALTTALMRLLADPALRRSMGAAGRRAAEESFDAGRALRELEVLYAGAA